MNLKTERQQRHQQKKRRRTLINMLNRLEVNNCHHCPNRNFDKGDSPHTICGGCHAFDEITKIGNALDQVGFNLRTIKLPDELNISTYRKLRELEWNNDDIRKYYRLKKFEFKAYLDFYEEKTKKGITV